MRPLPKTLGVLAALLLFPTLAWAQPSVDGVTGIAPGRNALDTAKLTDYLRAVEEATTTVTWDTAGDSRTSFGASRMSMTATWRKPRGGGAPVMTGAVIKPVGSKYIKLGKEKIYKLTLNSKGEIKVERDGIDTTVYKVTKKANGDLVLDLPWYHGGDRTIKAADIGPIDLSTWPPRIDEVVSSFTGRPKSAPGATRHEGTFHWEAKGRSGASTFPLRGGAVTGSTAFDFKGDARLDRDGSFRTIGNRNTATVTINVGGHTYARENGAMRVDAERGGGTFKGTYSISLPNSGAKDYLLDFDGNLSYDVTGRNIVLNVPHGPRFTGGRVRLKGDGRLAGTISTPGGSTTLRNGSYDLEVTGPITVNGVKTDTFTLDDLAFGEDSRIASRGTLDEVSSDRIRARGSVEGTLLGDTRGAIGVLLGDEGGRATTRLGKDTRIDFNLDDAHGDVTLPGYGGDRRKPTFTGSGTGRVHGNLDLRDPSVKTPSGSVSAERATTSFDLNVDVGEDGLRDGSGTINTRIDRGGNVNFEGLPGAPVLPGADRFRPHEVVSGDTLHKIARHYGVPVAKIKEANGIPASSSTIRLGETLKIPGTGPMPESDPATPGHWRSTIEDGSNVNLEIGKARIGPNGVVIDGFATATVNVQSADMVAGRLESKILGAARIGLARTAFNLRPGPDGKYQVKVDDIRVPVRIDLQPTSSLHLSSPGREMDIVIDRAGSYAEFTVKAHTDAQGKLKIDELAKVDLLLHSNSAVRFAGEVADLPGEKTVRYEGRMAFVPRGIDFFGDITIRATGDETTPALRIRW